jgi:hypothetical protein
MNLIDKIREEMGYPPFEKIDPNTQEARHEADIKNANQKTGQAAITAVLAGFYQISRTEHGFNYLLSKDKNVPWSVELFGDNAVEVVEKISRYGNSTSGEVSNLIDEAGNVTWKNVIERLDGHLDYESFKRLFTGIQTNLLQYLPPALQLGKMLHDSSIDDRTHKMEGPVSGLMHRIEQLF